MSTRKKAASNRVVKTLGYSILATTVTQKEVTSTGQKEEFSKRIEMFRSKVASLTLEGEIDYGFWTKNDSESMSFSELPGREFLKG